MTKIFSILSWNVEHFKLKKSGNSQNDYNKADARLNRIVEAIKAKKPDIMALYEVEGKMVFEAMMDNFPDYHFHITEGPQVQEILVGVHRNYAEFFTQKLEFKAGNSYLRPGALLTIKAEGEYYTILFLHTKSGADPKGFGLRDDMLKKAIKFRKNLDKKSDKPHGANYIFMGDLNTMGMKYPFNKNIDFRVELQKNSSYAKRYYHLDHLTKTHPYTFSNGSKSTIPDSDLDHVFASEHLKFKLYKNKEKEDCNVEVSGWVDQPTVQAKDKWIEDYSDHAILYMEVVR